MAYDKFWMIVNVSDAFDSPRGEKIPASQAPRFLHPTQEQAETELLRLQEKHQHGEFVLLEAVARAEQKQVFIVTPIEPDDGIPF